VHKSIITILIITLFSFSVDLVSEVGW